MLLDCIETEHDKEKLVSEAERYTLENPLEFPWEYNGLTAAFAEDNYVWRDAQVDYLWKYIKTDKAPDDFKHKLFSDATKDEEIELMEGAKDYIGYLFDVGVQPIIISNSSTEKGQRCSQVLGFDIPVYGKAQKYIVEEKLPFSIDGRTLYASRPKYEQIIMQVMSDYKVSPKEVSCVGNNFGLDLSLPYHKFGMNCVYVLNDLKDGFKTPEVFVRYVKSLRNIEVVPNLGHLIP